ncbi:MAG: EF-hand domain-containing protein [Thermoguttaceae bacterium]|nr:EF-hand domain-containing protein [Thermoguttaceae bacterium]
MKKLFLIAVAVLAIPFVCFADDPVPAAPKAPAHRHHGDFTIFKFDANNDGVVTKDELPKDAKFLAGLFDRIDADKDGKLTKAEDDAFKAELKKKFEARKAAAAKDGKKPFPPKHFGKKPFPGKPFPPKFDGKKPFPPKHFGKPFPGKPFPPKHFGKKPFPPKPFPPKFDADKAVDFIFAQADTNKDGQISREEAKAAVIKAQKKAEEMRKAAPRPFPPFPPKHFGKPFPGKPFPPKFDGKKPFPPKCGCMKGGKCFCKDCKCKKFAGKKPCGKKPCCKFDGKKPFPPKHFGKPFPPKHFGKPFPGKPFPPKCNCTKGGKCFCKDCKCAKFAGKPCCKKFAGKKPCCKKPCAAKCADKPCCKKPCVAKFAGKKPCCKKPCAAKCADKPCCKKPCFKKIAEHILKNFDADKAVNFVFAKVDTNKDDQISRDEAKVAAVKAHAKAVEIKKAIDAKRAAAGKKTFECPILKNFNADKAVDFVFGKVDTDKNGQISREEAKVAAVKAHAKAVEMKKAFDAKRAAAKKAAEVAK